MATSVEGSMALAAVRLTPVADLTIISDWVPI